LQRTKITELQPWASAKYGQVVTMAPLVQETNLAWALAEAITAHLSAVERNHVFVVIGAGETFAAIRHLFKSAAFKRIPLRPDLLRQCTSWLHAYVGHEDERYLRHLIENYLMPDSIHVLATVPVNRLTTPPNAGRVVALAAQRHRIGSATDSRFGIGAGIG
jgi:hypothetical protein